MRFRYIRVNKRPQPEKGETRIRVKFVFLPVFIGNYIVWMETFVERQKYTLHRTVTEYGGKCNVSEWVPLERRFNGDTEYYKVQ